MKSALPQFLSPPAFDRAEYLVESAWLEHAPFAYHLIFALQPTVLVELGTHHGFSFFSFCQAIQRYSPNTFAFAIDTWRGDEHSGLYGEDVYERVRRIQTQYSTFSSLVRATFSEAATSFADSSIDFLHIDGRHYYNDAKDDFEVWVPKLMRNAVVLFHDTNERDHNFGVWRYFDEMRGKYPSFNFLHGHGLGFLAVGDIPEVLSPFFDADSTTTALIRSVYARLGRSVTDAYNAERLGAIEAAYAHQQLLAAKSAELEQSLAEKSAELEQSLAEKSAERDQRLSDLAALTNRHVDVIQKLYDHVFSHAPASASDSIERRVSALEELGRKLDIKMVEMTETTALIRGNETAMNGQSAIIAEIERRLSKAERRIRRLLWHASILMPITGPFVITLRYITRKLSGFAKRLRRS